LRLARVVVEKKHWFYRIAIMLKTLSFINRPLGVAILLQVALAISAGHAQYPLQPSLDVAQFQDKARQPYLEIYYSLPEAAITYEPDTAGANKCRLLLSLQIYCERALWASQIWKIEKPFADTSELRRPQCLVDALIYLVDKPGRYRMVLQVRDLLQPGRIDSAAVEIEVQHFSPEKLEISGVELAAAIKPSAAPTAFAKHGQEVIPNVTALFGEGAPELYYYFEAYHLLQNVPGRKYKAFCRIHDAEGKIVEGTDNLFRTKTKRFDSSVEMGMIGIAQLPSGKYRLRCGIADSAATELASREKEFFVYNPGVSASRPRGEAEAQKIAAGPLQSLDEKALDEEFVRMIFLATANDRKFYKNLANANAKREFISSLWQSARAGETLSALAYRQRYLARAQEAAPRFKSLNRPGWKTDRGRVYILHGPPSRLDRSPSSTTTLPFETWTYDNLNGQGGVVFVFADRAGFGNYEQIHSTLQGELQDPHWRRLIMRSSSEANRAHEMQ
jgi:GWxTD domain-containing protein